MHPLGRSTALPPAIRTVENQAVLAALLAMIAGYVDAYAPTRFGSYASFMSGNTTQAGSRLGRWDAADTVIPLTAVAFLVTGIFVGVWLAHSARLRSGPVRPRQCPPGGRDRADPRRDDC